MVAAMVQLRYNLEIILGSRELSDSHVLSVDYLDARARHYFIIIISCSDIGQLVVEMLFKDDRKLWNRLATRSALFKEKRVNFVETVANIERSYNKGLLRLMAVVTYRTWVIIIQLLELSVYFSLLDNVLTFRWRIWMTPQFTYRLIPYPTHATVLFRLVGK